MYISTARRGCHLGDIKKIISRMGLTAELFLPPKGQPQYFDLIATEKFKAVYPGRSNPSDQDLDVLPYSCSLPACPCADT